MWIAHDPRGATIRLRAPLRWVDRLPLFEAWFPSMVHVLIRPDGVRIGTRAVAAASNIFVQPRRLVVDGPHQWFEIAIRALSPDDQAALQQLLDQAQQARRDRFGDGSCDVPHALRERVGR